MNAALIAGAGTDVEGLNDIVAGAGADVNGLNDIIGLAATLSGGLLHDLLGLLCSLGAWLTVLDEPGL